MQKLNNKSKKKIYQLIPHRKPFLFVDEILSCKKNQFVVTIKKISNKEAYFAGHFPKNPIMPGVLLVEAMAQTACILFNMTYSMHKDSKYYLVGVEARFYSPVVPPSIIKITVNAKKIISSGGMFDAHILENERLVAKCVLTMARK